MNKSTSVSTIPLDQALPGMVLAEEVRQKSGGILLPRSITLSENHIASLRHRDIQEITIEMEEQQTTEALSPEKKRALQKAIRTEVQHMFRRSEMDATMQALLRAVTEYRLEKIE